MYDKVKKLKGENYAKTIRSYNSSIFEIEGLIDLIRFSGTKAEPILQFLDNMSKNEKNTVSSETVENLIEKAGYDLFDFTKKDPTKEDFKFLCSFYYESERICTLNSFESFKERVKNYKTLFLIKKDAVIADKLTFNKDEKASPSNRSSQKERDDGYGTSVISIQMKNNYISIKNRYNHAVSNCDSTFGNNLDLIQIGLKSAIEKEFKVNLGKTNIELPNGYRFIDNHIVKYDYEINGEIIGDGFYSKNGKIISLKNGEQIVVDYFVFDFKTQKFIDVLKSNDGFVEAVNKLELKWSFNGKKKILFSGENIIQLEEENED